MKRDLLKEKFDGLDYSTLENFVEEGVQESLSLEFKIIVPADIQRSNNKLKNTKPIFAECLSGFANSSGGIVIWGIVAKEIEGVDCARELKPVESVHLVCSRFQSLTSEATSPVLEGVEHRLILRNQDDTSGFIATYIPESQKPPHMAKLGVNKYYKRSEDSFRMMEHFDLEDMFGRRPKPRLELGYMLYKGIGGGGGSNRYRNLHIHLVISNGGLGSAIAPYLSLQVSGAAIKTGSSENSSVALSFIPSDHNSVEKRFGADMQLVIHPRVSLEAVRLFLKVEYSRPPDQDVIVSYMLGAYGMPPIEDSIRINKNELYKFAYGNNE